MCIYWVLTICPTLFALASSFPISVTKVQPNCTAEGWKGWKSNQDSFLPIKNRNSG